jgi:hypothetical protein
LFEVAPGFSAVRSFISSAAEEGRDGFIDAGGESPGPRAVMGEDDQEAGTRMDLAFFEFARRMPGSYAGGTAV